VAKEVFKVSSRDLEDYVVTNGSGDARMEANILETPRIEVMD
jgi:hypothetical protein